MRRRVRWMALLAGMTAAAAAQSTSSRPSAGQTPAALHGDADHPAQTKDWVETRLYFGLGPVDRPERGVSEATWRRFLDREVTARFPTGLSVGEIYGQWRGQGARRPERLRSKMLILLYPATTENELLVDEIRSAWKRQTGDHSVLKVTERAEVSF